MLESFLVQHYILSRQIEIEILYDYPNWHTQLEGEMGHYIQIVFDAIKFHVEETYVY